MRFPALVSVVILASCASTPAALQDASPVPYRSSHVDLHLGGRALDKDDWDPVEDQGAIGIDFVHEGLDSAIGFEVAFFASRDKEEDEPSPTGPFDITGETQELSVGVRKTFMKDTSRFHPYVGGGLAAIRAQFRGEDSGGSGASDDDTSGAFYVHGGLEYDVGPAFLIGVDLRLLGGSDITLFGEDGTANYGQITFVVGCRF